MTGFFSSTSKQSISTEGRSMVVRRGAGWARSRSGARCGSPILMRDDRGGKAASW